MSEENKKNMHVDIELVRQLAAVLDETNLTEIEVEDGDRKVRVARKVSAAPVAYAAPAPVAAAPVAAAVPASMPSDPASITPAHENAVKSPMVGTAYLAAEPGAKPFIAVGSQVKAGDTLVIVEAMKVMNPIAAPHGGTVKAILIENGQPVEFDQPLVVVE
ncbi:acetyl-CoA carboxylase biotin carboxyl carrier protein [Sphingomonas koreensis]|jgi:acetyl-CoA carboxylase biotin carboxyl carrier protein|uniref:Biotin carboxyl carrier protein of acetyl-CoA carboxylase n=1 Tax=Sphingomonas koreensis TaxID=93064 RepID=A0A1L6JCB3_9SPHN|nr:acetyl-CoA carboxylase biotin carboxyl carrier protein [Sphingomonas koreensis]APR53533.1 acetyl-CoA carboxylase, biotin carboxyl carrier protein [Sphingomonas koreensis]MDC7809751.1 acetyl-CoA carboxylase biotin carboxyl carrier protein [Sphingomonas koreensis]RSU21010.1 acetyl-CoA carboxylase biotin carboxyl carrier protein [Sphingomonas koreensis]RSU22063.1 acetyl-CoA carboxylase biotin carboxyl carrier protein [Sphingomonas koreensis]RSU24335.1 acetyl-CoA carboxylase biotin carboxyl car